MGNAQDDERQGPVSGVYSTEHRKATYVTCGERTGEVSYEKDIISTVRIPGCGALLFSPGFLSWVETWETDPYSQRARQHAADALKAILQQLLEREDTLLVLIVTHDCNDPYIQSTLAWDVERHLGKAASFIEAIFLPRFPQMRVKIGYSAKVAVHHRHQHAPQVKAA